MVLCLLIAAGRNGGGASGGAKNIQFCIEYVVLPPLSITKCRALDRILKPIRYVNQLI